MSKHKTALVTGSSSGIGEGIATALLKNGYKVIMHGMESERAAQPVIDAAKKHGDVIAYYCLDLSDVGAIEDFQKNLSSRDLEVDILVNNAGIQYVADITEFPKEKWDKLLAVNLSSAFHLTRSLLPSMRAKKWGRIINIASAHGLVASLHKAAYVAAKHGLVGLTKVTALENADKGIACNAICPGWVLTPLVRKQIEKLAEEKNVSVAEAEKELLMEKQPSGQFVTPENIGDFVAFLCSEAAAQINGSALSIDGGWTAR